jgi:GxxExxY protein
MEPDRAEIERIARTIVDSIIKVHTELGPGLLESAYQTCLRYELEKRGFAVQTEVSIPIRYDDQLIEHGFRADMVIERKILIENKVVSAVSDVHRAQLLTYLKLSGFRIGFLVNWNTKLVKDGISRIVHQL